MLPPFRALGERLGSAGLLGETRRMHPAAGRNAESSGAARPWRPSGIVTLLTDFGLQDPYVGMMKGVLYREAPELRAVIDLSHEVPPQDVRTAALFLEGALAFFPAGTVHLAVVDPEVGTERALLLSETRAQAILAPDNGLLSGLVAGSSSSETIVRRVDRARTPLAGASATFHGRDRLAPLAALLVGGAPPASLGEPCADFRRLEPDEAELLPDGTLRAAVVTIDRFGNLITNARGEQLARLTATGSRRITCRVAGRTLELQRTYAEAARGALLCLLNSYDRLEIAERDGSAAARLGLSRGAEIVLVPMEV